MSGASHRPLRLPPGVDLRGELEALARQDPGLSGFVVCGIGSLESPVLRFADQDEGIVLAGPHEVITLAGSMTMDGAHLHLVVADAKGVTLGGHLCHGSRVRTTMELLMVCPEGWTLGRERDAATGHLELTLSPSPPSRPPLPGSPG
ncbi:PPC domain-containing DNA-binding protein [Synechococcus sp. CS-1332]|uniref:PPC domain-containing DNA-binding protein n=1 Tax=Synechococcus sp. CS-1332 TaxID=2847972 RepID=UPI00223B1DF8|nr:PPC domain-containing DNA-binding protein [Synechococcus sp. CS-1332]MCT0207008.1 DNA-binding protein [Synechococcus sp. CS-1332]